MAAFTYKGVIPAAGMIEQIKQSFSIMEAVETFGGVALKKKGSKYWACCPLHGEKTASFAVYPHKGTFHCFGCGEHGDSIDFVSKMLRLPLNDSVRLLAEQLGLEGGRAETAAARQQARQRRLEAEEQRELKTAIETAHITVITAYRELHRQADSFRHCIKNEADLSQYADGMAVIYEERYKATMLLDLLEEQLYKEGDSIENIAKIAAEIMEQLGKYTPQEV